MGSVLVTGGTGVLGRRVVEALGPRAHVRVMSRTDAEDVGGIEWVIADLEDGSDLAEALAGVDTLIHLTHADGTATRRLVEAARTAGVSRVVYVSIVGADRSPNPYYRMKVEAEEAVRGSGIEAAILRATQFHSFVDGYLTTLAELPLPRLLPVAARLQTIDEAEVAQALASIAMDGAPGAMSEIAGPESQTLGEMATSWFAARGIRSNVVSGKLSEDGFGYEPEPWAPEALRAFIRGDHTPAGSYRRGTVSWADFLERQYGGDR